MTRSLEPKAQVQPQKVASPWTKTPFPSYQSQIPTQKQTICAGNGFFYSEQFEFDIFSKTSHTKTVTFTQWWQQITASQIVLIDRKKPKCPRALYFHADRMLAIWHVCANLPSFQRQRTECMYQNVHKLYENSTPQKLGLSLHNTLTTKAKTKREKVEA